VVHQEDMADLLVVMVAYQEDSVDLPVDMVVHQEDMVDLPVATVVRQEATVVEALQENMVVLQVEFYSVDILLVITKDHLVDMEEVRQEDTGEVL